MKQKNEKEKLAFSAEMLKNAHHLLGVECQNCQYYTPDPETMEELNGYRGLCEYDAPRKTYWCQYCEDFKEKDEE